MKHILMIERHSLTHQRLRKRYDCTMSAIMEISKLKGSDKNLFERLYLVSNNADEEGWIEAAISINKTNPIDEIQCLVEAKQEIAAKIAKELNISYTLPEDVRVINDKYLARKRLKENSLCNLHFSYVNSKAELKEYFDKYNEPCIIKPIGGIGSKNIYKISSDEDILKLDDEMLKNKFIAETFINGKEYSVESISYKRKHKTLCVTEKIKDPVNYVEIGHVVPSDLSDEDFKQVTNFVEEALSVLGVYTGVSHMEVMKTATGVEMVEIQVRIGGDYIPEIVENVGGFNIIDIQCELAMNDETKCNALFETTPVCRSTCDHFCSVRFKFIDKTGKLVAISNVPEEESDSRILKVLEILEPGNEVEKTVDSFTRGTLVIGTGSTDKECLDFVTKLLDAIDYRIE